MKPLKHLMKKKVYISLHMSDMYYILYYICLLVSSNLNWLYIFVSLYSFTFLSFMDISPSDYLSPSELKFLFAFLYPRFMLPFLIFHTTLSIVPIHVLPLHRMLLASFLLVDLISFVHWRHLVYTVI